MSIIMTAKEYVRRLTVVANEPSYYDSTPGQNLLFVHDNLVRSGDCNNTIKAILNGYDVKRLVPGYYQSDLSNTGDITTEQLIELCTSVTADFSKLRAGFPECLHMMGHVGSYIGKEVTINGLIYNVIECTAWTGDFGHTGIIYSYVDKAGRRLSHKGGYQCGTWERHGLLSRWIDYSEQPGPTPKPTGVVFRYQVYDDVAKAWLPNVKNANDFAGLAGHDVDCVLIDCATGTKTGNVKYCVHTWHGDYSEPYPDGKWLGWTKNRKKAAGKKGRPIDAICIQSDQPAKYRVHLRGGDWLPWVKTKNANRKDPDKGYAGIIGRPIDAIQIKPV